MEKNKPSWYIFLDKSSKLLHNFYSEDKKWKNLWKRGGTLDEYSECISKYREYDRILNAKFLEIRESGKWKGYTEVIKWLKSEKRKLSVTAKQSIVLYPTEHTRVLYRDIKTYSNIIKRLRKERLNLLRKYGE